MGTPHPAMYILTLLSVFLISAVSVETHPDLDCFNEFIKGNKKNLTEGEFFIRIEHAGNIQDWFDNGDIFRVESGKVFEYNTTGTAMTDLCNNCSKELKDDLAEIEKKNRYLSVLYDGLNVWAGMAQMNISVTNTSAEDIWGTKCLVFTRVAARDEEKMSFTYINWDLDDSVDIPDLLKAKEEQLFLYGGANPSLGSFVTVIGFLLLSMFV